MTDDASRRPRRPPIPERPVPPRLPADGLLVGWSLEHEHRPRVVGFAPPPSPRPAEALALEPILATGEGHLLTIAPTGAGKGVSCVIPALLRHPGPVVVVDPKGEAYAITARHRRAMGDRVVLLDPFHVTDAADAGGLNPLDLLDLDSPMALDDAQIIAQMIVDRTSAKDPFWDERARQLIAALILHVVSDRPPVLRHLGEVHYLLNQSASDIEFTAKEMTASKRPEVKSRAAILTTAEPRVRASILSTAQAHAEILGSAPVQTALLQTDVQLEDITRGAPLAIYIVLPPDKLETHGKLLRLWLGVIFACLYRRRRAPAKPTLLVLDEAAQLGELPQLRQAVTLLRGYGVRTWSFWQDLSQLERLYPGDWRTIVNNCRVVQAFGLANLAAAETVRALSGFRSALEILDMDTDEMLLLAAGDEAVIAQRPNYLTDPPFAGLYDPNPFHTPADIADILPRKPQRTYRRSVTPPDRSSVQIREAVRPSGGDPPAESADAGLAVVQAAVALPGRYRAEGLEERASTASEIVAQTVWALQSEQVAPVLRMIASRLQAHLAAGERHEAWSQALGLLALWQRPATMVMADGSHAGLWGWREVLDQVGLRWSDSPPMRQLLADLAPRQAAALRAALGAPDSVSANLDDTAPDETEGGPA